MNHKLHSKNIELILKHHPELSYEEILSFDPKVFAALTEMANKINILDSSKRAKKVSKLLKNEGETAKCCEFIVDFLFDANENRFKHKTTANKMLGVLYSERKLHPDFEEEIDTILRENNTKRSKKLFDILNLKDKFGITQTAKYCKMILDSLGSNFSEADKEKFQGWKPTLAYKMIGVLYTKGKLHPDFVVKIEKIIKETTSVP